MLHHTTAAMSYLKKTYPWTACELPLVRELLARRDHVSRGFINGDYTRIAAELTGMQAFAQTPGLHDIVRVILLETLYMARRRRASQAASTQQPVLSPLEEIEHQLVGKLVSP